MKGMINEELRLKVFLARLTYRAIASTMGISHEWLSRAMARPLTPDMRKRIEAAIDELTRGRL